MFGLMDDTATDNDITTFKVHSFRIIESQAHVSQMKHNYAKRLFTQSIPIHSWLMAVR